LKVNLPLNIDASRPTIDHNKREVAMTRLHICSATLGMMLCACGVESPLTSPTATIEQQGVTLQGVTLQGVTLQGVTLQGMNLQGILVAGATLAGAPLDHVRVERGEVVAEQGGTTLRGTISLPATNSPIGGNPDSMSLRSVDRMRTSWRAMPRGIGAGALILLDV